jgi:hypothetical protein
MMINNHSAEYARDRLLLTIGGLFEDYMISSTRVAAISLSSLLGPSLSLTHILWIVEGDNHCRCQIDRRILRRRRKHYKMQVKLKVLLDGRSLEICVNHGQELNVVSLVIIVICVVVFLGWVPDPVYSSMSLQSCLNFLLLYGLLMICTDEEKQIMDVLHLPTMTMTKLECKSPPPHGSGVIDHCFYVINPFVEGGFSRLNTVTVDTHVAISCSTFIPFVIQIA